jgi:hypothetical protein
MSFTRLSGAAALLLAASCSSALAAEAFNNAILFSIGTAPSFSKIEDTDLNDDPGLNLMVGYQHLFHSSGSPVGGYLGAGLTLQHLTAETKTGSDSIDAGYVAPVLSGGLAVVASDRVVIEIGPFIGYGFIWGGDDHEDFNGSGMVGGGMVQVLFLAGRHFVLGAHLGFETKDGTITFKNSDTALDISSSGVMAGVSCGACF